jgi:hypothetical protein
MTAARSILVAGIVLGWGAAAGCMGPRQTRRDVYLNLMTPLQEANYRLLEARRKPVSLRLAYLQEIGAYQTWSEQPKGIQATVLRRQVLEGMSPVQVQMAWGPPERQAETTDAADRAAGHRRVVWDYAFRPGGSDDAYERSVCFFDDEVLWIRDAR